MTSFEKEGLITYDNDGSVRLLPGYMFDPTDEVLVDFYLKRRVFAQPLPVHIISDFDVFQTEPWKLPGGDGKIFNERKCFFYNTRGRDLESLDIRVSGSGQWKVMEKDKDVPIPRNNEVIGKRNTLIFWEMQGACSRRTKWVMHEFRLVLITNPSKVAPSKFFAFVLFITSIIISFIFIAQMQMSNWVVYRIFIKKDEKKVKNANESNGESPNGDMNGGSAQIIDFNAENDSFSPSPMNPSLSERSESA